MIKNEDYLTQEIVYPGGRKEIRKIPIRDATTKEDMKKLKMCEDFTVTRVLGGLRGVPKDEICIKCCNRWNKGGDVAICPECHKIELKKPWSKYL